MGNQTAPTDTGPARPPGTSAPHHGSTELPAGPRQTEQLPPGCATLPARLQDGCNQRPGQVAAVPSGRDGDHSSNCTKDSKTTPGEGGQDPSPATEPGETPAAISCPPPASQTLQQQPPSRMKMPQWAADWGNWPQDRAHQQGQGTGSTEDPTPHQCCPLQAVGVQESPTPQSLPARPLRCDRRWPKCSPSASPALL